MPRQGRNLHGEGSVFFVITGDYCVIKYASCLRLHSSLICKHRNFIIISALFKKAFCKCQIYKPLTIFSKYKFHNLANASCKLAVTLAPLTEILAAVHLR